MNSRPMVVEDRDTLQGTMDRSTWHSGLKAESYMVNGATFVYGEVAPVAFLNCSKVLMLRVSWYDEKDTAHNKEAIVQLIGDAVKLAKENGYAELIFQTDNPALGKFCGKLGFEGSQGVYRREVE
jgi:hypothetical protein